MRAGHRFECSGRRAASALEGASVSICASAAMWPRGSAAISATPPPACAAQATVGAGRCASRLASADVETRVVPLALQAGAVWRQLQRAAQVGAHVYEGAHLAVGAHDQHGPAEEVDFSRRLVVELGLIYQWNTHDEFLSRAIWCSCNCCTSNNVTTLACRMLRRQQFSRTLWLCRGQSPFHPSSSSTSCASPPGEPCSPRTPRLSDASSASSTGPAVTSSH